MEPVRLEDSKLEGVQTVFQAGRNGDMEILDEDSSSSATDQAMSIQLIAEKIFAHLSFYDVQACALVNKTWNFHARNVCKYEAVITESDSCSQLSELNSLLETCANVPFDGLSITGPCLNDCSCIPEVSLTSILQKIDIKYLTIYLFKESPCPTVAAIQRILSEVSWNLKKLNLFVFPSSITSLKEFIQGEAEWLRNLKSLAIPSFEGEDRVSVPFLKEILEAAPNLLVLKGIVNPAYLNVILEWRKGSAITDFDFDPNAREFLASSLEFARSGPSLEKLRIGTVTEIVEVHLPVELIEIMKLLLLGSGDSLKELRIDHFNLFLYTRLYIPPLKGVTKMSITYEDVGQGIVNLRRVDFAGFFPSLETVEIRYEDLSNIDVQIPGDFQRLICPTVKNLKLSVGNRELNLNPVDNFSKMFPNVEHFYCSGCLDLREICIYLWSAWVELETISFTDLASHHIPNLDWMFCGIFEAEAIHLLKFSGGLKDYHLVPCFPSILNCKKLKKFRVEIKHFGRDCEVNRFFPSFLSRTTGELAFSRIPGLVTEIKFRTYCRQVPCGYSLDHLKPFARLGEFEDPETLVYLF